MYTEKQVDDMLSQVEQEFEKALGSINKNEENKETEVAVEVTPEIEIQEEVIAKSEETVEAVETVEEEADYKTVDELYASMDKSEKEAHYNSIKKSLASEYEKEEVKEEVVEIKSEEPMAKSENEVKLETENEELKKNLDTMNGLLDTIFNKKAPQGKAITATSYIAKSEGSENEEDSIESMTKSEITSKLKDINYTDLSKSDRNAINDFCLKNGTKESIKHLI